FCKSTERAVEPFRRLQSRLRQEPKGDGSAADSGRSKERLSQKPKGDSPQASLASPKGAEPKASLIASKEAKPKAGLVKPKATDLVFPNKPRELLNSILAEVNLKRDRDGNVRTAYSLRHTY